jgi:hypothetical protein
MPRRRRFPAHQPKLNRHRAAAVCWVSQCSTHPNDIADNTVTPGLVVGRVARSDTHHRNHANLRHASEAELLRRIGQLFLDADHFGQAGTSAA